MGYKKSQVIVTVLGIIIGLMHFVIGPNYKGTFKLFVAGYLLDILVPMMLYLLGINFKSKFFRNRYVRIGGVLFIGFAVETCQYFGIEIFGSTFDPIDYTMYVLGVVLGVLLDVFWLSEKPKKT